ncbi:MAG: hypothetical protein ACKVXR_09770 [Planctomycetota bacterium]
MDQATTARPFRWGFWSASGLILLLVCIGQAAGFAIADFGRGGMRGKDWLFLAFALSGAVFLVLQRGAVARFFRTMHVGVSLISLAALAVVVGVLVPQIEGFEDPDERVPSISDVPDDVVASYLSAPKREADAWAGPRPDDHPSLASLAPDQVARLKGYRREYEAFRWAEGYFLYHLMHPYGIGMPEPGLPPQVVESLDRFGDRYGTEEKKNREVQMRAALSGREKTQEIGRLIGKHQTTFRRAFDVCTALHLNRAYKSSWFATLLWLLGIGVFFNTFKGGAERLLSMKKIGFFTVHMGVMTILAGGFVSKLMTDRGILHLDLADPPTDTYWAYHSPEKKTRMPFSLKLERFARKDWPTLEVGFFADTFKSMLPEYTLWPGLRKDLDFVTGEDGVARPRIHLEVLALSARAEVRSPRFWEAEDPADPEGAGPLAELSVAMGGTSGDDDLPDPHDPHASAQGRASTQTAILKPDYPDRNTLYDPAWMFRLRIMHGADAEEAKRALADVDSGIVGTLSARGANAGEVDLRRIPFRLGDEIEVAGYKVVVEEATANFRLDSNGKTEIRDPRPLADQYPIRPAVWVRITPEDGEAPERRLLLEALDWEAQGRQKLFTYKDLVLKLEWERWTSPGPPRHVLHWRPDGRAELFSSDGTSRQVLLGEPLPLPGPTRVTPINLLTNALYEKQIAFLAPPIEGPHFDEHFYATDPVGLEITVTSDPGTPDERREVVRMASTDESLANMWSDASDRFYLRFYGNDRALPFEWRSVLSVYEKDADGKLYKVDVGPEDDREIRVNDYFHYRGYRFFQTNARPEMPTYSGVGVVYDPGIPVVLLGMYLTIAGTVLAFIVRPIFERRKPAVQPAEATA